MKTQVHEDDLFNHPADLLVSYTDSELSYQKLYPLRKLVIEKGSSLLIIISSYCKIHFLHYFAYAALTFGYSIT